MKPKARWHGESAPLPLSCLWNNKDKTPRSYFIQSKSLVLSSKTNNKRCQYLFLIQSPLSNFPVPPRCSVNKLNKREETAWKRSFNCAGMPHQHSFNQNSFYRCINLHVTKKEMWKQKGFNPYWLKPGSFFLFCFFRRFGWIISFSDLQM